MKLFIIVLIFLFCAPISIQAQWVWQQTSGPEGGDVTCILTVNNDWFVGSHQGNIFYSDNNGVSWKSLNLGLNVIADVHVLCKKDSNLLFAGTYGNGIFRSTDNGKKWMPVNIGLTNDSVLCLAVSGSRLLAGTYGGGIFVSQNDGNSWTRSNNGLSNNSINTFLKSKNVLFAATDGGIFRSNDNGLNWLLTGFENIQVTTLAIKDSLLFAGNFLGIYCSDNNGQSWKEIKQTDKLVNAIAAVGDNLLIGTLRGGIFCSKDNGTTWVETNKGLASHIIYAILNQGNQILVATSNGLYRFADGNEWQLINGIANAYISSLIYFKNKLYAGAQNKGLFYSSDAGTNWSAPLDSSFQKYITCLIPNKNHLLIGTLKGLFQISNNSISWYPVQSHFKNIRINTATSDDKYIYFGTNHGVILYDKTTSKDSLLNRGLDDKMILTLTADSQYIYAVTGEGEIFISADKGKRWKKTPKENLNSTTISVLLSTGKILFSGTDHGVFVSYNKGNSWKKSGLEDKYVYTMYQYKNYVIAGTVGSGIFVSSDNGETWSSQNTGLTNLTITSLASDNSVLFVGTEGHGVFSTVLNK
ncbi:MAG: hypothetical protein IT235_05595 [Bacteroidia bacterium]|nr:hypothetical protein [Bacteroidia bacterium]